MPWLLKTFQVFVQQNVCILGSSILGYTSLSSALLQSTCVLELLGLKTWLKLKLRQILAIQKNASSFCRHIATYITYTYIRFAVVKPTKSQKIFSYSKDQKKELADQIFKSCILMSLIYMETSINDVRRFSVILVQGMKKLCVLVFTSRRNKN